MVVKKIQRFFRSIKYAKINDKKEISLLWDTKLLQLSKQYNKKSNMLWKLKNISQVSKDRAISVYYEEVRGEHIRNLVEWIRNRIQKTKFGPVNDKKDVDTCMLTIQNEALWGRRFRRASIISRSNSPKPFAPPKPKKQKSELSHAETKKLKASNFMKAPVFNYLPTQDKLRNMIFNTAIIHY